MNKTKYKPPICPACEQPLVKVFETEYDIYFFNPKTGTYRVEPCDIDIKCGNCEADVRDVLDEGACNYQANENDT